MNDDVLPAAVGETLVDCLRHWARERPDHPGYGFASFDGDELRLATLSFATADRAARAFAVFLAEMTDPGDRVALLLEPGLDFVTAFFGCLYAGVVAVPLYPPDTNRSNDRIDSVLADAGAACLVTSTRAQAAVKEWLNTAPAEITRSVLCLGEVHPDLAGEWSAPDITAESTAFLQYTSGSTRAPSGVMVSHANLRVNCQQIGDRMGADENTTITSWLPLFHDMGLIFGVAAPAVLGVRVAQLSPLAFVQSPVRWLRLITEVRGTAAAAPDFGYALCASRVTALQRERLDLDSWRHAISGAEPVRAQTLRAFAAAFEPCGFRASAFAPGYGLAEATLCVTGPRESERGRTVSLDRAELTGGRVALAEPGGAGAVEVVACGTPMRGQRVAIVDPTTGQPLPEDQVGEIWVTGPNVAGGYFGQPESSAEVFRARLEPDDGRTYLRTGDLGFLEAGQCYVVGRIKDLIIIDGRNHYPADIEHTVEGAHPAARRHGSVAFSVDDGGQERLVVAVELEPAALRGGEPAGLLAELAGAIRAAVSEGHEVRVHDVVPLRRGALPKTSSGKVRRGACRAAYLAGSLTAAAAITGAA